MALRNNNGRTTHYALIFGAACYWAAMLMNISGLMVRLPILSELNYLQTSIIVTLVAIILSLFAQAFDTQKTSLILSVIALAVLPAGLTLSLVTGLSFFEDFGTAILVCLWGLNFILLDAVQAAKQVFLTALLAIVFFFLLLISPEFIEFILYKFMLVLSAICSLYLALNNSELSYDTPSPVEVSTESPLPKTAIIRFYCSRSLQGFVIGLVMGLATFPEPFSANTFTIRTVASVLSILLIIAFLYFALVEKQPDYYHFLPALPLMIIGLIITPFIAGGAQAVIQATIPTVWMSWILTSSAQLSTFKAELGIEQKQLVFSEKAILKTFWTIAFIVGIEIMQALSLEENHANGYIAAGLSYALAMVSTISLLRLSVKQGHKKVFSVSPEEHRTLLCDKIASAHNLTPREREVLEILAAGRSRIYIEEKLSISGSTAKTHIYHIYEKLGIRKKEQLLEFVSKYEAKEGK